MYVDSQVSCVRVIGGQGAFATNGTAVYWTFMCAKAIPCSGMICYSHLGK